MRAATCSSRMAARTRPRTSSGSTRARGAGLDLAHPHPREVVPRPDAARDVVVENFVAGVVARLGCDYATLSAIKPDLVYCSISGFGQTGPLRSMQAFAHIIQAVSGVMHLEQQGDPAPRLNYLQTADVLAGTQAFGAVMAALWRRARTGRGAYLDVAMLECLVASEDVTFGSVPHGGEEYPGPRRAWSIHTLAGRSFAMQTVGAPQSLAAVLETMKRPELAKVRASPPARAPPALGRAARDHRGLARHLPHRGRRHLGARRRAPAGGAGAVTARGERASASGGASVLRRRPASHARPRRRDNDSVPGRRRAPDAGGRGAVSRGRGHARCADGGPGLRRRARGEPSQGRRDRGGVSMV